jgi:hypothetical protein
MFKDVDGRDERGHDESRALVLGNLSAVMPAKAGIQ